MTYPLGVDGAITNFMPDIEQAARESNGFVLEIGVALGTGSTIAIQNGLKDHPYPLHISVDIEDRMVAKPYVPWWHLIIGDSRDKMTRVKVGSLSDGKRPGLIFIDTDHTDGQITAELLTWNVIADKGTVWLFHDTHMFGQPNTRMVRAIQEFADTYGLVYEDFRPEAHGLGRMRYAGS